MPGLYMLAEDHLKTRTVLLSDHRLKGIKCIKHFGRELVCVSQKDIDQAVQMLNARLTGQT